jgi:MFS family permease
MDGDSGVTMDKASSRRLVLPSLIFSAFATYPMSIVSNLLLVEMSLAFGQPVGVMSQMRTLSFVVGFLSALAMGALSVRFGPKALLLSGLLLLSMSAFGCGSALNLPMLFILFAISGLGTSMVEPMTSTLVAEHYPVDERPRVIGWIGAGGGLSYIVGGSAVGYIAILGGWRMAFLGYAMLLPLLGFIMISKGIPSASRGPRQNGVKLTEGFRVILSNKSAVACLLGNLLASAAGQGIYVYSFSFLKEVHLAPPGWTAAVFTTASVCFFLGSLVCGWLVERLGRKKVTASALLLASLFTGLYANLPGLGAVVVLIFLGHFFLAIQYSAASSLSLEQVPGFRGTMMSLNSASAYIGYALGTGVGGLVLLRFGWELLSIVLGAVFFTSVMIYYLARDPTRDP